VALGYFRLGVPARGPPLPAWLLARPPSQRNGVSTTRGNSDSIQAETAPGSAPKPINKQQTVALGTAFQRTTSYSSRLGARRTTVLAVLQAWTHRWCWLLDERESPLRRGAISERCPVLPTQFLSVNVADSVDRYAAVAVCITTAQSPFLERGRRSPRHTTFVKSPPRPACPRGASGGA
jgi:hypothetical protein